MPQAGRKPALALLGAAVREGVGHHVAGRLALQRVVADRGRGLQGGVHVCLFDEGRPAAVLLALVPSDGVTPAARVDPLVRAVGEEIGFRSAAISHLQLAGSLWTLKLDSELLFSGDGGTTEPSRASRRSGIELGALYAPADWIVVDADLAWTRARFTDPDPVGDRIPNAVESVMSMGVTLNRETGWFGGARLRYFGPAPLLEDNSVRSSSTLVVNIEGGYHFSSSLRGVITVFNVLDRRDNDIAYYYASQLKGEAAPVNDIHFHPVEPRTVRAALTMRF